VQDLGKTLIIFGLILVVAGVVIFFGGSMGLGRLPGDIHLRKGNVQFYFPVVTSLLLSVLLSVILWLFRR
jgi:hypothetical protein